MQDNKNNNNYCIPDSKPYVRNVFVTDGSFNSFADYLATKNNCSVFLIGDFNTADYCFPLVADILKPYLICNPVFFESGENSKSLKNAQIIWSKLLDCNADRNTIVINLGGGMICDLGGFAASIFKRGIPFINIPTSLLAMVDAAIGGKTAVNFEHYKNQVGTFHFPEFIYINTSFLNTLPENEILSGFAEVIKYALIADAELWNKINRFTTLNSIKIDCREIIDHCVVRKTEIVNKDPFEKNFRKLLNAGHTIGHALESMFLLKNKTITHGHAVALGLLAECFIANQLYNLPAEKYNEISGLISRFYAKIKLNKNELKLLSEILQADKKNNNNQIGFSLINDIGKSNFNYYLSKEKLSELLNKYFYEKN